MKDKRERILIVDDDENVLISLEQLLEDEGFSTATAWSGKEALKLLQTADFDLLLVDEQLPDLELSELFQDVRPQAYRLVLLPASGPEDRQLAPGVDAAVCKWKPNEITAKVRSCFVA